MVSTINQIRTPVLFLVGKRHGGGGRAPLPHVTISISLGFSFIFKQIVHIGAVWLLGETDSPKTVMFSLNLREELKLLQIHS